VRRFVRAANESFPCSRHCNSITMIPLATIGVRFVDSGSTWEKSLEHYRTTKHRVMCQGCDDGEGMIWVPGSQEYLDHLKEQNVCKTCQIYFESTSNLDNVREVLSFRNLRLTPALASNGAFGTID
jgi:hypothetical protein